MLASALALVTVLALGLAAAQSVQAQSFDVLYSFKGPPDGAYTLAGLIQDSAGALYGITRQTVIELARDTDLKVSEPNLTRYDLFCADECFLTGTGAEIVPVVKIDGRVIGTGKPGAITRKLVAAYHALTKASGEPIY